MNVKRIMCVEKKNQENVFGIRFILCAFYLSDVVSNVS